MVGTVSGMKAVKCGDDLTIDFYQGKTIDFNIIWGGSTHIDVTGYSARLQIRQTKDSSLHSEFTVANGRVTVGGTDGKISFTMNSVDSAALTAGQYLYEIELVTGTDGGGNDIVNTVQSGICNIIGEIAK